MMAAQALERVRNLVAVNTGPSTAGPEFGRMLSGWAATLRADDGTLKLLGELWPFSVNDRFRSGDQGRATLQQWSAVNAAVNGAGMANVIEGVAGFDGTAFLAKIKARTLLVAGSADPSAVVVRKLVERVAGATYHEVEGARHIANVDEADAFTAALVRFLT